MAKLASLALEISDFFANDAIHQDEIRAGIYTTPYEVSAADERSQLLKKSGSDNFLFYNNTLVNSYYSVDAINAAINRSTVLSWLSFLPNYQLPYVGSALVQSFNGVAKTASDHAIDATSNLALRSANVEVYGLLAQAALQSSASAAFQASYQGAQAKRMWDEADIDFKRRRTQAARDNADEKVRLTCKPGGAYNYAEQIDSLVTRMMRDLSDALSRLVAASQGLKTIYGQDVQLPGSIVGVLGSKADDWNAITVLDDALNWVRNAIAFLVAFTQRDQQYTLTVSLRQTLPKHPWPHENQDWHSGEESGTWKFTISEDLFPGQTYVRLRGVSILSRGTDGVWKGSIRPPVNSFYRHSADSTVAVDQSQVQTALVGRIRPRSPDLNADVIGKTSLRNVAPFGEWTLTFADKSTQDESRGDLDDIEIDLDFAVRGQ